MLPPYNGAIAHAYHDLPRCAYTRVHELSQTRSISSICTRVGLCHYRKTNAGLSDQRERPQRTTILFSLFLPRIPAGDGRGRRQPWERSGSPPGDELADGMPPRMSAAVRPSPTSSASGKGPKAVCPNHSEAKLGKPRCYLRQMLEGRDGLSLTLACEYDSTGLMGVHGVNTLTSTTAEAKIDVRAIIRELMDPELRSFVVHRSVAGPAELWC